MGNDRNGRWKWVAGVATACVMMLGSGGGGAAWSAYEQHSRTLEKHGEAIVRLTVLAETQQTALERIEKALVELAKRR